VTQEKGLRFNVCRSGEIRGIASNIASIFRLIDADVVDGHGRWECQIVEINRPEVGGEAEISNDILQMTESTTVCN
jgi:hypothetical protein